MTRPRRFSEGLPVTPDAAIAATAIARQALAPEPPRRTTRRRRAGTAPPPRPTPPSPPGTRCDRCHIRPATVGVYATPSPAADLIARLCNHCLTRLADTGRLPTKDNPMTDPLDTAANQAIHRALLVVGENDAGNDQAIRTILDGLDTEETFELVTALACLPLDAVRWHGGDPRAWFDNRVRWIADEVDPL